MGNTVEQWRASIGSRSTVYVVTASTKGTEPQNLWFSLLVVMVLLVIGGVEMNPGPDLNKMFTFVKAKGCANMTGELYEIKLIALLFLRAVQTGQEFRVASNLKAAGSFDDVVLTLGDCTLFLQLKHKEKPDTVIKLRELTNSKKYKLPKYLESYLDIKHRWEDDPDLRCCGRFEDAKFVIYTNARVDEGLVNSAGSTELLSIVSTGGKCVCLNDLFDSLSKYKGVLSATVASEKVIETQELWDVVHKLYNKQTETLPSRKELQEMLENLVSLGDLNCYQQFISQLYLCTGQTGEKDLDDYIRCEICSDTILEKFLGGVQDWWRTSSSYLTGKTQFWLDVLDTCSANINKQSSLLNVKFLEEHCNAMKQILKSDCKVIYVYTKCIHLSSVKVLQSLQTNLLVDVDTLETHLNEVLAVWKLGMCDVLVVEGETVDFDILDRLVNKQNSKRIVMVSGAKPTQLHHQFKFVSFTDDTFSLSQLDYDSQQNILEREVMFQGSTVKLSSLVDLSFFQRIVTADVVVQLLNNTLEIGQKLDDLDPCYVCRTFLRREFLNEEIFREDITLAISGMSGLGQLLQGREENQKPFICKYFCIEGETEFADICKVNESIHWIQACEEGFCWKKSKGDVSLILNHLEQKSRKYAGAEEITMLPHKLVLVVAEPGMGKSTEMCNIAHRIKEKNASTWVIMVDLNQHTHLMSQNQVDAVGFLEAVTALNTDFQKRLFERQLQSNGNIVILLDGFDEISPIYSEKVFYLLNEMLVNRIDKIFVTSRPVTSEQLQTRLSTLAFSFQPFTLKDQENFLVRYWSRSLEGHFDLTDFISSVLQLLGTSLNDKLKEFTGIPLQTRMLAEVFQQEAIHYCLTGEIKLPQNLDVLELYDKFVDKKWKVYCKKLYGDVVNAMLEEHIQNQKLRFQQNLMNCAMISYLDDENVRCLKRLDSVSKQNQVFLEGFNSGHDKTGIVVNVANGKAVFVHRTFTEYFVAKWYSQNFHLEIKSLKNMYFDKSFQTVQKFLDRILAQRCKLHVAVLNENLSNVKDLLLIQNTDVNEKDEGGRTALHLAIINCCNSKDNYSIIRTLLEHGADVNCEDKILQWRPLRFAEENRTWPVVDMLLGKQADSRDLVWVRSNVKRKLCFKNPQEVARNEGYAKSVMSALKLGMSVQNCMSDRLQDVMRIALSKGCVNFTEFILKCGVSVAHPITDKDEFRIHKPSMLHIAVRFGQLRLVHFLLQQTVDVDLSSVNYKRTPLMWAAIYGNAEVARLLLNNGASVNARDKHGYTSLSIAVSRRKNEIVDLLLQKGADVDVCIGERGRTPLMQAALCGHLPIAELLISHGASVNARDKYGYTALSLAAKSERSNIIELLKQHGARE